MRNKPIGRRSRMAGVKFSTTCATRNKKEPTPRQRRGVGPETYYMKMPQAHFNTRLFMITARVAET
jgi:hypothetical protein